MAALKALLLLLAVSALPAERVVTAQLSPPPEAGTAVVVQGWARPGEGPPQSFEVSATTGEGGLLELTIPLSRAVDLRLAVAGRAPVYFWNLQADAEQIGEIRLAAGGSISGYIRDGVTEDAAVSAVVRLAGSGAGLTPEERRRQANLAISTHADSRGWFQLSGVPAGRWWLEVRAEGRASTREAVEVTADAETIVDLVVMGRLALTVAVDPLPPAAGVWFLFLRRTDDSGSSLSVPFDGQGLGFVSELDPGLYEVGIQVEEAGRVANIWREEIELAADTFLPVELEVVELRGRVRLGSQPLSGAAIELRTGAGDSWRFTTDANGELSGLARVPRRQALFASIRSAEPKIETDLRIRDYELTDQALEIEIKLSPAEISGVVLMPEGRPAAGATVQLEAQELSAVEGAATKVDDKGRFELRGLPQGRYLLHASGAGGLGSAAVTVELGEVSPAPVELQLVRSGWVSGRVVAVGAEQVGLSGVKIEVSVTSPAFTHWSATSDLDGYFRLFLPVGADRAAVQVYAPSVGLWAACRGLPSAGEQWLWALPAAGELVFDIKADESLPPVSAGQLFVATSGGGLLRMTDFFRWQAMRGEPRDAEKFAGVAADSYALDYHLGSRWTLVDQLCTQGYGTPAKGWEILAAGGSVELALDLRPAQKAEASLP